MDSEPARPVIGERDEPPPKGSGDCQQGTVLMLVPVGVLITALLASIAVDSAAAVLAQREAQSAASSLANDLVSLGIDEASLRRHGSYRLDASRLRNLSQWGQRMAAEQLSAVFEPGSVSVAVSAAGPMAVRVSVSGSARRVIGLIGNVDGRSNWHVSAEAIARVRLSG